MPSVYLERRGELRCIAQRGLWQILDGMCGWSGITGQTWMTGEPTVVPDVSRCPEYLESIPGVVSEICVPVKIGDSTVGALNIESLVPLPTGMLEQLERAAALLADRLHAIGDTLEESAWDRTVQASVAISGITDQPHMPERLVRCVKDASQMDSAALVLATLGGHAVAAAAGPLAEDLFNLSPSDLESLSSLVGEIRSCYTGSRRARPGVRGHRLPPRRRGQGGGRSPVVGPADPGGQRGAGPLPTRPAEQRGDQTPRDVGRPCGLRAGLQRPIGVVPAVLTPECGPIARSVRTRGGRISYTRDG